MVEAKIDRSDQACRVMPSGTGTKNLRASPIPMESSAGTGFAPCTQRQLEVCWCSRIMFQVIASSSVSSER